ncbi:MAG: DMT family transporter [Solirubrobacterales bacterium]|nr:DMT family transporter [Solirubrobacterales bacterium]
MPALNAAPSARSLVALGILGLVHAAVNYFLFFALVAKLGAVRASVTSYVAPAVAVLLGVVFRHEPAGGGLVAGLLLILVGSWCGTGGTLPPGFSAQRRPSIRRRATEARGGAAGPTRAILRRGTARVQASRRGTTSWTPAPVHQ